MDMSNLVVVCFPAEMDWYKQCRPSAIIFERMFCFSCVPIPGHGRCPFHVHHKDEQLRNLIRDVGPQVFFDVFGLLGLGSKGIFCYDN